MPLPPALEFAQEYLSVKYFGTCYPNLATVPSITSHESDVNPFSHGIGAPIITDAELDGILAVAGILLQDRAEEARKLMENADRMGAVVIRMRRHYLTAYIVHDQPAE